MYPFQEKLRVAVLVSKAALQFLHGMPSDWSILVTAITCRFLQLI
jgi:hypothetical protein